MIIDFRTNPGHAWLHDIVDASTGESMADMPIFYADDETGIYRVYRTDRYGCFYIDPARPDEAAWEERKGTFRLVLKSDSAGAQATSAQAESWRDRPPLL